MATNPCTLERLQSRQGCLSCFSQSERLQLKVWLLTKLYEGLGGTLPTLSEMEALVACFACEPEAVLDAFELAALQSAASKAGATLDGTDVADLTTAELKEAIKCYGCANPKLIRAAYYYQLCVTLPRVVSPPLV